MYEMRSGVAQDKKRKHFQVKFAGRDCRIGNNWILELSYCYWKIVYDIGKIPWCL